VLVPSSPGALSALGVLTADVVKEQSRTVMLRADAAGQSKLRPVFAGMTRDARTLLRHEGFSDQNQRHEQSLAVRYQGQSFELQIKQTTGDIARAFHHAHRARYGYAQEKNVVEIVSARLRSVGVVQKMKEQRSTIKSRSIAKPHDFAETYFDRKKMRVAVYRREKLIAGVRLRTPCIVTEYSATTLVPESVAASVDEHSNLIIQL
jgi:N-methylhydantoinase A